MTAHPDEPTTHETDLTRERGSSAPTWQYGPPDLGLGPVTQPVQPARSDNAALDGVEG